VSDDGDLWVNFYGGNKVSTTLADGSPIALTQTTDYPWDGRITVSIDQAAIHKPISLHFRIPGWTENPTVMVDGIKTDIQPDPGSYFELCRYWSSGDEIVLHFPMPVRLMEANPKITKLRDRVAIMRGPVVYCLELPKQEGGEKTFKNGIFLSANIHLAPEYRDDFLGGVTVLNGTALTHERKQALLSDKSVSEDVSNVFQWKEGELYRPMKPTRSDMPTAGTVDIELIPYYAWANRGLAYMDVWIPLAR
jgi:hypothetical protein